MNGTFINDVQILPDCWRDLLNGDKIRLGYDPITFTAQYDSTCSESVQSNIRKINEIPSHLTEPERCMPPLICELNDSMMESLTTEELETEAEPELQLPVKEEVSSSKAYDNWTPKEQNVSNTNLAIEPCSDSTSDNSATVVVTAKPAESFTIGFPDEVASSSVGLPDTEDSLLDQNLSSQAGLSSFVPSRLRASFENRDKTKRTKIQTTTSGSKSSKHSDSPRSNRTETRTVSVTKETKPCVTVATRPRSAAKVGKTKVDTSVTNKRTGVAAVSVGIRGVTGVKRAANCGPESQKKSVSTRPTASTVGRGAKKPPETATFSRKPQRVSQVKSAQLPTKDEHNTKSYLIQKMLTGNDENHHSDDDQQNGDSVLDNFLTYDRKQRLTSPPSAVPTADRSNNSTFNTLYCNNQPEDVAPVTFANPRQISHLQTCDVDPVDKSPVFDPDNVSEAGTYVIGDEEKTNKTTTVTNYNEDEDIPDDATIDMDETSTISSASFKKLSQEIESKSTPSKWLGVDPNQGDLVGGGGGGSVGGNQMNTSFTMAPPDRNISADYYYDSGYTDDTMVGGYGGREANYGFRSDSLNNNGGGGNSMYQQSTGGNSKFGSKYRSNSSSVVTGQEVYVTGDELSGQILGTTLPYSATGRPEQASGGGYRMVTVDDEDDCLSGLNFASYGAASSGGTHQKNNNSQQAAHRVGHPTAAAAAAIVKQHPRSTFSVASLDTALLLQDTEALLNDMEKRVYSRKDVRSSTGDESQSSQNNLSGSVAMTATAAVLANSSDKIPFVDENEDRDDEYGGGVVASGNFSNTTCTAGTANGPPIIKDDKPRSCAVKSPINNNNGGSGCDRTGSGTGGGSTIVRRNNSCKQMAGGGASVGIRTQRSCSMIEEHHHSHHRTGDQAQPQNLPPGMELLPDHKLAAANKAKLPNAGALILNRRASASGASVASPAGSGTVPVFGHALSSPGGVPASRLEQYYHGGQSHYLPQQHQKTATKDHFAANFVNSSFLPFHRQRFNRYEYGQHSLKYNSSSTTMLYQKQSYMSPLWNNADDGPCSTRYGGHAMNDMDYYPYNTMPDSFDASLLPSNIPNIIGTSQPQLLNLDAAVDSEFQKRTELLNELAILQQQQSLLIQQQHHHHHPGQQQQHSSHHHHQQQLGVVSGRSSAFSPVNSLHQSNESINHVGPKSRSSLAINEQQYRTGNGYDVLMVSSIHHYSARLCRYAEEIIHKLRREDPELQFSSSTPPGGPSNGLGPGEPFGKLKSVNKELSESLNNMRTLEKLLQKMDRAMFPTEMSGRNSAMGSCSENSYLDQLERINKEIKEFVPIQARASGGSSQLSGPSSEQQLHQVAVASADSVVPTTTTIAISVASAAAGKSSLSSSRSKDHKSKAKADFSTSKSSSSSSKYSSLSKRFQTRKD